jgi:DNA-binding response OmpR family regulator
MAAILVVDDDRDICSLLEYKLRTCGHVVTVEHDGRAGLARIAEDEVELVLLDWMMPGTGGLEVCQAVRADPRRAGLPLLMLTAKAQEADVQRALDAGVSDYILKPFSPREVAARVTAALARVRN